MAVEKNFFRQVMGQFVTGVTVVTARSQGKVAGLTVNAFSSVSLNPPLVLVCVDLTSSTLPVIRESGAFAINMLTKEQEHLSSCFATSSEERYERFCHATYHAAATGSPVIDNILAFIDARIVAEYPGGDHAIFLAEVVALGMDGQVIFASEEDRAKSSLTEYNETTMPADTAPLVYFQGKYRHLAWNYSKPSIEPVREQVRE